MQFRWAQLATGVRVRHVGKGTAGAEPVILPHGYTDSWFSWSPVLPLMPEGYHVFAFDQRGHGCSERPEGAYGMSDLAADVIAFMDAGDWHALPSSDTRWAASSPSRLRSPHPNAWRALMDGMLAIQPTTEPGALRIPTLILWGEQDTVFPRSEQDALLLPLL